MQPILMLAIAGVAAIALGTGFLNNDIDLWIQDFGVGAGNIELPADHAIIDFNIVQQEIANSNPVRYENVIDKCVVTLNAAVGSDANEDKLSEVTCKVTGKIEDLNNPGQWIPSGQVITEGKVCASSFAANTPIMVPLGVLTGCDANTNPVDGPTTVNPKDAGDVILVVHANTYNNGQDLPQ